MLRALPKKWRRNFVPVADFADAVLSSLDESKGALGAQLSSKLRYMTGVTLPEKIWDEINIPEHLQMSFKVIDRDGKTIHSGRDLSTLLDKSYKSSTPSKGTFNIEKNSRVSNGEQRHKVERQNLQQWDFGDIPTSVTVRRHGIEMTLYPALTKPSVDSSRVDLTLVETAELASTTNQHGITTLFLNQYKTQLSSLIAPPFETQSICLQALKLGRCKSIINQLLTISVTESMQKSSSYNHTHLQQQSFEQSALDALNTLPQTLKKNRNLIADIVKLYHQISNQLKGNIPPSQLLTYSKIKSHLDTLVYPNFITNTPLEWLTHLPRYLKGVERRIDKLSNSPDKDRVWAQQLSLLWDRIEDSLNYEEHNSCDKFIEYRWMLEEYRISLFAQELGTVKPVSVERLNKLWRQL
jgi:ATP-dependent helicase HrpA